MPDAGDDILQNAPLACMEQHIIRHHAAHAMARGEIGEVMQPQLIVWPAPQGQRHIGAVAKILLQAAQLAPAMFVRCVRQKYHQQTFAICHHIGPAEMALRLAAALFAQREQPAEPRIGRPIGGIDQQRHALRQIQPAADDQAEASGFGGLIGADDAGERIAIDDGQRFDAEMRRLRKQLLTGAGTPQEREMRGDLQLGIARLRFGIFGHPKIPCRNQDCVPVSGCSPSPDRKIQKRSPCSSSTWK